MLKGAVDFWLQTQPCNLAWKKWVVLKRSLVDQVRGSWPMRLQTDQVRGSWPTRLQTGLKAGCHVRCHAAWGHTRETSWLRDGGTFDNLKNCFCYQGGAFEGLVCIRLVLRCENKPPLPQMISTKPQTGKFTFIFSSCNPWHSTFQKKKNWPFHPNFPKSFFPQYLSFSSGGHSPTHLCDHAYQVFIKFKCLSCCAFCLQRKFSRNFRKFTSASVEMLEFGWAYVLTPLLSTLGHTKSQFPSDTNVYLLFSSELLGELDFSRNLNVFIIFQYF